MIQHREHVWITCTVNRIWTGVHVRERAHTATYTDTDTDTGVRILCAIGIRVLYKIARTKPDTGTGTETCTGIRTYLFSLWGGGQALELAMTAQYYE